MRFSKKRDNTDVAVSIIQNLETMLKSGEVETKEIKKEVERGIDEFLESGFVPERVGRQYYVVVKEIAEALLGLPEEERGKILKEKSKKAMKKIGLKITPLDREDLFKKFSHASHPSEVVYAITRDIIRRVDKKLGRPCSIDEFLGKMKKVGVDTNMWGPVEFLAKYIIPQRELYWNGVLEDILAVPTWDLMLFSRGVWEHLAPWWIMEFELYDPLTGKRRNLRENPLFRLNQGGDTVVDIENVEKFEKIMKNLAEYGLHEAIGVAEYFHWETSPTKNGDGKQKNPRERKAYVNTSIGTTMDDYEISSLIAGVPFESTNNWWDKRDKKKNKSLCMEDAPEDTKRFLDKKKLDSFHAGEIRLNGGTAALKYWAEHSPPGKICSLRTAMCTLNGGYEGVLDRDVLEFIEKGTIYGRKVTTADKFIDEIKRMKR